MASAKFLEEALSTAVDESAVNAIVGCLENQLGTSTSSATPQQGSQQEATQNHMNSAISNGGAVSTQKHGVSPVDSMNNVLLNDGNKTNASSMATTQTTTIGQINTVLGSVPSTVISRSNYVNQLPTSLGLTQTSLANLTKGQEPLRILYPAASQAAGSQTTNNRVTFPVQTVTTLQNGNMGLTPLSAVNPGSTVSQNPLPSSTNVTKPGGNIGVLNCQDQSKSSSPALVIKTSGTPLTTQTVSVPSGVMSVPLSVNSSIAMAGPTLNSVVTGSSPSTNVSGVVTVTKALPPTVATSSTNIIPGNLLLNVNAVRPATPGAPGQKTVGSRVLVGTPHLIGNRLATPATYSLQAIQGLPSQGAIYFKTDHGILLRVASNAVTSTTMNSSTTSSVGATPGTQPTFRLHPIPAVSSNNGTNTVKVPLYLPVATTAVTSVQSTTASVPALTTQTIVSAQPQVRPQPEVQTKEKCRKFLANLLDLSTREPKTVEKNVRLLIQELVDGKVEPDEFCTRLERLLNASPQPCLIGFLKKSLPLLRQSMISNELVIEGIRPPPAPATPRPQPSAVLLTPTTTTNTAAATVGPQIQNQVRPACITTQTVRVVTPFSAATTPTAGTVIGGLQSPRPTLTMQHRLVTVPMTTSAPGLVPVSTVSTVTTPVVSTPSTALSPMPITTATTGVVAAPPLHRPTGPQTLAMQTRTLMPVKQPIGVRPQMVMRAQSPMIRTTTPPVRVTTPINKTNAIQTKVNTHTKVTTIQKPAGKIENFIPNLASVRMPVPSLAVASSVATSAPSTLAPAVAPSVLPSLASTPGLTPSSTPTSTVLVVSSAAQTVSTSTVISTPTLVTASSYPLPYAVPTPPPPPFIKVMAKEKKSYSSAGYTADDDINDVAAMGGVNLAEETQRILGSTEFVGTQIRSCKDDIFLHATPLQQRIRKIVAEHGLDEPLGDVAALISHATQEKLKNIVEKLDVIAEHRLDLIKMDQRYEVAQDVKGQLKFLEELDRMERKRHDEQERELLLRAAKSRSKTEDPEQAKLKAKAREMQRAEMEEVRQREANLTALQAIGPRKKPRLDGPNPNGEISSQAGCVGGNSSGSLNRMPLSSRPRLKRVNLRDLVFLLEQEKDTRRSPFLYKAYLK